MRESVLVFEEKADPGSKAGTTKKMKNDMYRRFVRRWEQVTDLPPQTVGPLTPFYKAIVRRIKVMPWPVMAICSLLSVVGLYLLIGSAITLLVSILQRGF